MYKHSKTHPERLQDLPASPTRKIFARPLANRAGKTLSEWLRLRFRPAGAPSPVARKLILFNNQRGHGYLGDAVAPQDVRALRGRLDLLAEGELPSDDDMRLLRQLELSGQALWVNLYAAESMSPFEIPTQHEALKLWAMKCREGSHFDQHIFEVPPQTNEDKKRLYTAGGKLERRWEHGGLNKHRQGVEYLGIKKDAETPGRGTRVISIDMDRHSGAVPLETHKRSVLETLSHLQRHFPELAPHVANINPKNGSCHIVMYLPELWSIDQATAWIARLREDCPWLAGIQIYPDRNSTQFILPMRLDKTTIIDRVMVPCIDATKRPKNQNGGRDTVHYLALDFQAYLLWIEDPDRKPCDQVAVESAILEAGQRMPDAPHAQQSTPSSQRKLAPKPKKIGAKKPGGMGTILSYKGRCASMLVDFWSGKVCPPDDTIGKFIAPTLRIFFIVEDMEQEDAVQWVMRHLRDLVNRAFSNRLMNDQAELERVVRATADAIWSDNGYQHDPEGSTATLLKVREAWNRRGFILSDESTWRLASSPGKAKQSVALVMTSFLMLVVLPDLARVCNCDHDAAVRVLTIICNHVNNKSQMAERYLIRLLRDAGVHGYNKKATAVIELLLFQRVLERLKRGFIEPGRTTGIGSHFACCATIQFSATPENEEKRRGIYPIALHDDPPSRPTTQHQRRQAALRLWDANIRAYGWFPSDLRQAG